MPWIGNSEFQVRAMASLLLQSSQLRCVDAAQLQRTGLRSSVRTVQLSVSLQRDGDARCGWPASFIGRVGSQLHRAEAGAQLLHEHFRSLHGREVPTAWQLVPIDDVLVATFGPAA